MAKILNYSNENFITLLNNFIYNNRRVGVDISEQVKNIVSNVEKNGDKAINELTLKYDNYNIAEEGILVSKNDISHAYDSCDKELISALEKAAERISAFHKLQTPKDITYIDESNVSLSSRWTALDSVGLYVPGGKASYPSSVIMTAIPAKIANVPDISMCVPSPNGYLNPAVLVAAKISGVKTTLYADFVRNDDADEDIGYIAGIKAGSVKKRGDLAFGYAYQDLEADAVLGAHTDSDFGGSSTDSKGSKIQTTIGLSKKTNLSLTYLDNEYGGANNTSKNDYNRLQVDLNSKF